MPPTTPISTTGSTQRHDRRRAGFDGDGAGGAFAVGWTVTWVVSFPDDAFSPADDSTAISQLLTRELPAMSGRSVSARRPGVARDGPPRCAGRGGILQCSKRRARRGICYDMPI